VSTARKIGIKSRGIISSGRAREDIQRNSGKGTTNTLAGVFLNVWESMIQCNDFISIMAAKIITSQFNNKNNKGITDCGNTINYLKVIIIIIT